MVTQVAMAKKPLEILKAGLASLKEQIKTHQDAILKRISDKEAISETEEHWLDNEANLVDEDRVVEILENASDYERGLERLSSQQKSLAEKLKDLGGGIKKLAGNKRKRMFIKSMNMNVHTVTYCFRARAASQGHSSC